MTQEAADAGEAAAIERYRRMRRLWAPCWGARGRDRAERDDADGRAGGSHRTR
jgi:hypothetical protein